MKCKKTIDARRYSHQTLEEMRVGAVKRVESGESPEEAAVGLGINRRTIYRWLSSYHYGGMDGIKAKPIPGGPRKLDGKQMEQLSRTVREKNPLQLKFEYALWTLSMIREIIRREFGVKLSEVSVGRVMRRLGFTPQRPLYRAWQQNPQVVQTWRDQEYPWISARAKLEGAQIYFADESGMRSDHHAGTTWAPVGKTPIVKATGRRFSLNMLSAVSAKGHFRFMTVEGGVTGAVFVEFLKRLITGAEQKIFLIVDGHPSHKARAVKRFVDSHADRIELFFLPPYSPELNPDELAWAHIKAKVAKVVAQTMDEMKAAVERAMHQLQKMPNIVASFFHVPTCAYTKL